MTTSSARYLKRYLGMLGLAIVMLVAGVASRAAGAPFFVLFIFLGLMVVCAVVGFRFVLVARTKQREELSQLRAGLAQPRRDRPDLP
jgi:uncharacterized membrane protein